MKQIIIFITVFLFAVNVQINEAQIRPFLGFPPTQFFQDYVLQAESQKLLATPNLPEDLQQRVLDTMSAAEAGFNDCNTMSNTLPWMQIRCVTLQLQKSKIILKAIEDEAKAREAAAPAE